VDHATGSRDVRQLSGLGRVMPITAVAAGVAALSMVGLPPLFGFISKELLYEAQLQAPRAAPLVTAVGVAATILLVAVAGMVGLRPFLGPKTDMLTAPHEASFPLWVGPMLLAVLGIVLGLFPETLAGLLVTPAANAVHAAPTEITLALWHGLNPVLALSLLTIACGVGVYSGRGAWRRAAAHFGFTARWGPQAWYTVTLDGLNATARLQTRVLQSGYLRYYLLIISVTILGLAGSTLFIGSGSINLPLHVDVQFYEWVLPVLILLAAVVAVLSGSRLGAVAALGVVGYSVALIFVLFGAPDLAMTQFMVETLTVILFVLVFSHLPRFALFSNRLAVVRDTCVALALGGLITCIVASGASIQLFPKISQYFIDNSLSLAHGRNIVNVILVDFRGFDTLGEITVLAVAGIGVYALLKLRLGKEERQ
jgi:multicomponent Na+:H+ antiporter subunit A